MALTPEKCARLMATARSEQRGKPVANNTRLFRNEDGSFRLRLHQTDIIVVRADNTHVLAMGGWNTCTTRERLSRFSHARVGTERGIPYVWHYPSNSLFEFFDGIRVMPGGLPFEQDRRLKGADPSRYAAQRKVEKMISEYVKGFAAEAGANGIPLPGPGDCWGCCMQPVDAKGTVVVQGHYTPDLKDRVVYAPGALEAMGYDHYFQHFEEKYYVPSLLVRAARSAGYRDEQIGYWWPRATPNGRVSGATWIVKKCLRSYFTKIKGFLIEEYLAQQALEVQHADA